MATSGYGYSIQKEEITINERKIKFKDCNREELELLISEINENIKQFNCKVDLYVDECHEKKKLLENNRELIEKNLYIVENCLPRLYDKAESYINFIKRIYFDYYNLTKNFVYDNLDYFTENAQHYLVNNNEMISKITNLPKIEIFSEIKKNILIVGGNGAGKSSFVSFLKKYYSNEIIILPAQKVLMYDSSIHGLSSTDERAISTIQAENIIDLTHAQTVFLNSHTFITSFSKIVTGLVNITLEQQNNYIKELKKNNNSKNGKMFEFEEPNTIFDDFSKIWETIFPNIKLEISALERTIIPMDINENKYSLNMMSDGEKAAIYYIANVLFAPDYSYIVVDEPEVHINPAIYKRMWNILEKVKPNCQFIYISHDIEFIKTRRNAKMIWMKKYIHKDYWDFQEINYDESIPKEILIEIYGSKSKIIFCEGDKENSLDYEIYSHLFMDYTVIPVGSCYNVINYTKVFNNENLIHNNEVIGLIDFDNREECAIEKYKKEKIYQTKYNEIEMLLCDEEIIKSTISNLDGKEIDKRIIKFKNDFFKRIKNNREKIAINHTKQYVNAYLEKYKINSKNITDIDNEIADLKNAINVDDEYKNYLNLIDKSIEENDYEGLLKLCNLKEEIVCGLGNNLISEYKMQAKNVICTSKAEYIRNKYFDF